MTVFTNFIKEHFDNVILSDLELKDKPITVFYDYPVRSIDELKVNPYNILFIQEPNQLFGFHDWALSNSQYFNIILTWGDELLSKTSNSYFFPFAPGDFNMPDEYKDNKIFEVSFMCGPKHMIEGHRLRHRIYNSVDNITIPTKYFFEGDKRPCWNSMYHIAVENSTNKNYFTEKIIDAFLSKTIPVYWGCPNIDQFFNMDGVITFDDEKEMYEKVNKLTPEFYYSKKDAIEENYNTAMEYADFVGRIRDFLKEICKLNNI